VVVGDGMGRVVPRSSTQRMIAEIDTSRFTSGPDMNRGVSILAIMVAVPPAGRRGAGMGPAREHITQPTTPRACQTHTVILRWPGARRPWAGPFVTTSRND